MKQIDDAITLSEDLNVEVERVADALRAPLPIFVEAIDLLDEGKAAFVAVNENKSNAAIIKSLSDKRMRDEADPRHEDIGQTRKRVEADIAREVFGPLAEQLEAEFRPRAEEVTTRLVAAMSAAFKVEATLTVRLKKPAVAELTADERSQLPSLEGFYRSMGLPALIERVAALWKVDGDDSHEILIVDAACRGWLAEFAQPGPTIGRGWQPSGPPSPTQAQAAELLRALDTVRARGGAPALRLVQEIIAAEKELFVKVVGCDFSVKGNMSAADFRSYKPTTADPLRVADSWPFRYVTDTAGLTFGAWRAPELAKLNPRATR